MEDTTTNIIVSKGNDNIKDSDNTIQTGPDTFNDVILPEYKDLIKQIEEAIRMKLRIINLNMRI